MSLNQFAEHKPLFSEQKPQIKHSVAEITSPFNEDNSSQIDKDVKNVFKDELLENDLSCNKKVEPEKIASYTEMIAKAIFSGKGNMSTLQDIYEFLIENFPILKSRGKSWKNSVRHTLSLNEWFVKIPRTDNGKSCYWSIHPIYLNRFRKGDFQKQRKSGITRLHHSSKRTHVFPSYFYTESTPSDYPHMVPTLPSPYREHCPYVSNPTLPNLSLQYYPSAAIPNRSHTDSDSQSYIKTDKTDIKPYSLKSPSSYFFSPYQKYPQDQLSPCGAQKMYMESLRQSPMMHFPQTFSPSYGNTYSGDNNVKSSIETRNMYFPTDYRTCHVTDFPYAPYTPY
ncbi:forkhead box protein fkh-2 [Hydra vulgaris]|uniref:forkhead box protein fkh-2 n=1 Tax=Hydra vulgaris TaxID=6087 RepID=UPI00019261DD|nr:forkhead box protein C1 [Hydra vulgaris]